MEDSHILFPAAGLACLEHGTAANRKFWRVGGYDAKFLIRSESRISSLLPDASDEEKQDLLRGIRIMWISYYPMQQRYDLALDCGLLLFEMSEHEEALALLSHFE